MLLHLVWGAALWKVGTKYPLSLVLLLMDSTKQLYSPQALPSDSVRLLPYAVLAHY